MVKMKCEGGHVKLPDVLLVSLPPVSPELTHTADATIASHVLPPLGIQYLVDAIFRTGTAETVRFTDFALTDFSAATDQGAIEELVETSLLAAQRGAVPDVIGVSLMFSSSYDFFKLVVAVARRIWVGATIMVGGIHASNTVAFVFSDNPEVDVVVCGEAEAALPEFLRSLACGETRDIRGVHTKSNLKTSSDNKFEMTAFVEDIDLHFTNYSRVLDMDLFTGRTSLFSLSKSSLSVKSFAVMGSRGCPVHCTFCAAHTIHGHAARWRTMDNITAEIRWLHDQYGVTKIYLMDDTFVPKRKAIELFTALAELEIPDFEIVIQNLSINHTDYDIIDAIARMKINNIAFAIETGSAVVQKRIKKYCNLGRAIELVQYCQRLKLNVRCFYILGFPGESIAEMQETIDYARKCGADWSTFNVAVPLPGSEMYDEFVAMGCIEDGPSSWRATTIRDRLFDTPEISAADIKGMAYAANLDVNFVHNATILSGDLENARVIFSNFVKSLDFHLFGFDCLRRICLLSGDEAGAQDHLEHMRHLMRTNEKSQAFRDYLHMLDKEVQAYLSDSTAAV